MAEAASASAPDRVLRLARYYPFPRERVFAAWTEPASLARWWGPRGMQIPRCELDLRVGGAWHTTMRGEDGTEREVSGVYREIEPPARLVFTWAWHSDGSRGPETTVTVEFIARDGGTDLRLSQEMFESNAVRDLHGEGWSSSLDCLGEALPALI